MRRKDTRSTELKRLSENLRVWELGSKPVLHSATEDLRRLLNADVLLSYGLELGEEHMQTTFLHEAGALRAPVARTFNAFLARVPPVGWTFFNPLRPEPKQRNAALRLRDIEALTGKRAADAPVQAVLSRIGVGGMDQLRILLCDGEQMLAAICAYRHGDFSLDEVGSLRALAPGLVRRLRHERDLEEVSFLRSSRDAFLEAIPRPAFLLSPSGRVLAANASGEAALDGDAGLRGCLRDAAAGRKPARVHSREVLQARGMPKGIFVTLTPDGPDHCAAVPALGARWGLTPRERDVLRLLMSGKPNKAIAVDLGVATPTVELHVSRILAKAGAASRAELMVAVWRASR